MINAIDVYRLARKLSDRRFPILPKLLYSTNFLLFNSVIPITAEIGEESKLAYGGVGVIIHAEAQIGRRVIIGQGVTIGRKIAPDSVPIIGDNVYIGPGCRILGKIRVGDNVMIGANSVVISDVPNNCIVAGSPARVIRHVNVDIYSMLENVFPIESCDFTGAT